MGWNEDAVEKALWIRPGNKALRRASQHGTESGSQYSSETVASEIAIARSKGTVTRAHELLKACGLLRLVRAGTRKDGNASIWKVRVPKKNEEETLRMMGVAAATVLRQAQKLNRKVRKAMRDAARHAESKAGIGAVDATLSGGSGYVDEMAAGDSGRTPYIYR